jgi:UPF0755 protein
LKKSTKVLFAVVLLVFFLAIAVFIDFMYYIHKPLDWEEKKVDFIIYPGQGFNKTLEILEKSNVVKHPDKLKIYARLIGLDKKLKAGEYTISTSMSPSEMLNMMVNGRVKLHKLTIPEGYSFKQIATLVETSGMGSAEDFLITAADMNFVQEMGIDAGNFEGYLFPETYYFPKGVSAKKIISTMVHRFGSVFKEEWKNQAKNLGLSVHEVVTLASIIEKETGAAFERPVISSVFHNRLRRGMRLETDPTVIYGLKYFNGNLTRKHLLTPSAYNTYLNHGLPPGPIANPGRESIQAALFPADTKYLFFVSKRDSTHQFSTNIRDHNNAVRKYQLRR